MPVNNNQYPITPAGAKAYYKATGRWPKGYEPKKEYEEPKTATERSAMRLDMNDGKGGWLPSEAKLFPNTPYQGSKTASNDSSVVDEETGRFGGMFARRKKEQQKTTAELLKENNEFSRQNAIFNFTNGYPLSHADSTWLKKEGYIKEEKPKTNAERLKEDNSFIVEDAIHKYLTGETLADSDSTALKKNGWIKDVRPTEALNDSLARWQLEALAGNPEAAEKLGKAKSLKEYMTGKSKKQKEVTEKDFLSAIDEYETNDENSMLGKIRLKRALGVIDSFAIQALEKEYPAQQYFGKKKYIKETGRMYISNGRYWMPNE